MKPVIPIEVRTLGPLLIHRAGQEETSLYQQPLRCAVFVYLAHQREATRETLIRLFWPDRDAERGRRLLSQTLYELKRSLGQDWVTATGERIAVNGVRIDTRDLEAAIEAGDYSAAARLYRGRFLENFPFETNEFEAWASSVRAQAERLGRRTHRELIQRSLDQGDLANALVAAQAWIQLDPLEDEAQHRTIEILALLGRRAEALQTYEQYRARLAEELELEPMEQTSQLAAQLRSSEARPLPPVTVPVAVTQEAVALASAASRGAVRKKWRWLGVLTVPALAAILIMALQPSAKVATLPLGPTGSDLSRIAVLYFDDHSPRGELGYLAKGLTEALIDQLSRVDALSVISRNGVKPFAAQSIPLDSIARALNVGTLVEASVQRSGDLLRVNVHLVDAASGERIQSTVVQKPFGELFALEDAIASEVSRFLRQRLGRAFALRAPPYPTKSAEAWGLYQKADELREQLLSANPLLMPRRPQNWERLLEQSDALARAALAKDAGWEAPRLLRSWLAHDRALLNRGDVSAVIRSLNDAMRSADKLLTDRPEDAQVLELKGILEYKLAREEGKLPEDALVRSAETHLRNAVERDPTRARAWHTLGRLKLYAGAADEASQYAQRALEADAFLREAPEVFNLLYRVEMERGRFDNAGKWCNTGHQEFPENYLLLECHLVIAIHDPRGRMPMDSAWRVLHKLERIDPRVAGAPPEYKFIFRETMIASLWAKNGRPDSARAVLQRAEREVRQHPAISAPFGLDAGTVYLLARDTAAAVAAVQGYLDRNPQYGSYVKNKALYAPIVSALRFGSGPAAANPKR